MARAVTYIALAVCICPLSGPVMYREQSISPSKFHQPIKISSEDGELAGNVKGVQAQILGLCLAVASLPGVSSANLAPLGGDQPEPAQLRMGCSSRLCTGTDMWLSAREERLA